MKKFCLRAVALILVINILLPSLHIVAADSPMEQAVMNLVQNPGFETLNAKSLPVNWFSWNSIWKLSTVSHSGEYSALYQNADASTYRVLSQTLTAVPDRQYIFSCWIKTEKINNGGAATVCLEWYDQDNKYLGGSYAPGASGTADWQLISSRTEDLPTTAKTLRATLYVSKGATGKAWFDDLSVTEYSPAFDGQIKIPAYRDQMTGGNSSAPVIISGALGAKYMTQELSLTAQITSADESQVYVSKVVENPKETTVNMNLPTATLPNGDYLVSFGVYNGSEKNTLTELRSRFSKVEGSLKTAVSFRSDGIALVNDTPFFPLGVYESESVSKQVGYDNLMQIAEGGFNAFINFNQYNGSVNDINKYLDYADSLGLKCIFNMADVVKGTTKTVGSWSGTDEIFDGLIGSFKNHPALLSWYIADECPLSMHDQLVSRYQRLVNNDKNHPAFSVSNQPTLLRSYTDTTDVMGVDPYPIPSSPLTMVADWTDRAVASGKPAWIVPQMFDWARYKTNQVSAMPTRSQVRCMTYLALTHGATGLIYFSYFDLKRSSNFAENWANLTSVSTEVKAIMPWLVSTQRGETAVINGLHTRYFQNDGQGLLMVVNPSDSAISATIPVDKAATGVSNYVTHEAATVKGNGITETVAPQDVNIYLIKLKETVTILP